MQVIFSLQDRNSDNIFEFGGLGLFSYSLAVYGAVIEIVNTWLQRNLPELYQKV